MWKRLLAIFWKGELQLLLPVESARYFHCLVSDPSRPQFTVQVEKKFIPVLAITEHLYTYMHCYLLGLRVPH